MNKKNVILIIIVQTLILLLMVFYSFTPILFGQKVELSVHPVDPRSLFRGDYVRLGYDFNTIENFSGRFEENEAIYIILKGEYDGVYEMAGYSLEKPSSDTLFIKGSMNYQYENTLHADFPTIESFFVEEHTGLEIEEAMRENKVFAEVYVDSRGNTRIKDLIIR